MITTVIDLKEYIEGEKFAKGDNEVNVQEWAAEIELAVDEADKYIRQLAGKIEEIDCM